MTKSAATIATVTSPVRDSEWDEQVAREYREAYSRIPVTEEELRWAESAAREAVEEEPW